MDARTIQNKIKALESLADSTRASTPEHERVAAARMLDRFRRILAEQTNTPIHSNGQPGPDRWYGGKYANTRDLSLTDIAKLIRAEIKVARKVAKMTAEPGSLKVADPIGDTPAEVKIGVRTQYYSGGGSINVTISNIPDAWGWTEVVDSRCLNGQPRRVATGALKALAKAIREIMDSYNYDGSDVMTDYFDKRFYGHVTSPAGLILG